MINIEQVKDERVETYKQLVITNWNKSRDSIIKVGKILIEAKNKCKKKELDGYGWNKICNYELPFGKKTANRLIKIANCEWITSGKYNDSLPVSWGTLHEISRLSKERFEKGIENGTIKPDCIRSDIEKYIQSFEDNVEIPDELVAVSESSGAESSGAVTTTKPKDDRNSVIGKVFININKCDKSQILKLQQVINDAVKDYSKWSRVDFDQYNKMVEERESKANRKVLVKSLTEDYSKLKNSFIVGVKENSSLCQKYVGDTEKEDQLERDFFEVKDFSFLATKYIQQFGIDSFDSVVKNSKLPKNYLNGIRSTVQVAA